MQIRTAELRCVLEAPAPAGEQGMNGLPLIFSDVLFPNPAQLLSFTVQQGFRWKCSLPRFLQRIPSLLENGERFRAWCWETALRLIVVGRVPDTSILKHCNCMAGCHPELVLILKRGN